MEDSIIKKRRYTLIVLTENTPGVLHRITSVFTRRSMNIESLTVSETEREEVARFTLVFMAQEDRVPLVVQQIRRFIEVVSAVVHTDEELLFKEIAFLRVSFENLQDREDIEQLAFEHYANIVMTDGKSLVVEKTGSEDEINKMKEAFSDKPILNFIRSGRISINKHRGDKQIGIR